MWTWKMIFAVGGHRPTVLERASLETTKCYIKSSRKKEKAAESIMEDKLTGLKGGSGF